MNGRGNNYCRKRGAHAWTWGNYSRVEAVKNARIRALARRIGTRSSPFTVRRLCGRFGADYGFVLSLIPVSYGQQFTGYHRTAINFGYLAWPVPVFPRLCLHRGDRWDSSHIKLPWPEWNIVCKAWSVRMTRRRARSADWQWRNRRTPGRLIANRARHSPLSCLA